MTSIFDGDLHVGSIHRMLLEIKFDSLTTNLHAICALCTLVSREILKITREFDRFKKHKITLTPCCMSPNACTDMFRKCLRSFLTFENAINKIIFWQEIKLEKNPFFFPNSLSQLTVFHCLRVFTQGVNWKLTPGLVRQIGGVKDARFTPAGMVPDTSQAEV